MDGQIPRSENHLQAAVARARSMWEAKSGGDPVAAARAAARCFSEMDSPEAAFWRGNFLTQGYMTATTEGASYITSDIRDLRNDGVDALREATRSEASTVSAQARYLLGQVDQMDRSR